MKLYKFGFCDYRDREIERDILECEEKPKTYITKERKFKTRISKEEIGTVQEWVGLCVLLAEDDFEKAQKIYLDYYESKNRERKYSP